MTSRPPPWRVAAVIAAASCFLACGLDSGGTGGAPRADAASSSGSGEAASTSGSGEAASTSGSGDVTSSSSAGTGGAGGGGAGGGGGEGGGAAGCDALGEFRGGPEGHCYWQARERLSWDAARQGCVDWGGDLGGIRGEDEYMFVLANATADDYWVGGHSAAADGDPGAYTWANGEPWGEDGWAMTASVFPWKNHKPENNEPCLKMHAGFESKTCDHLPAQGYLCERE